MYSDVYFSGNLGNGEWCRDRGCSIIASVNGGSEYQHTFIIAGSQNTNRGRWQSAPLSQMQLITFKPKPKSRNRMRVDFLVFRGQPLLAHATIEQLQLRRHSQLPEFPAKNITIHHTYRDIDASYSTNDFSLPF